MAAHEGEKPTRPVVDGTAADPATAGNPAASSLALKDLGLSTRWLNLLTGAGLESAQDLLALLSQGDDAFLDIPGIGGKALEEVQGRLAELGLLEGEDAEGGDCQEQQAASAVERITHEGAGAAELKREAMEDQVVNPTSAATTRTAKAEELPISFAVRLAVDEQGQPIRTEIEPARKEIEPGRLKGLDGQKLVSYIEEYIRTVITLAPRPSPALPPEEARDRTPEPISTEPVLTISEVRVVGVGTPGRRSVRLGAGQAFVLQVRFELGGVGATSTAAKQHSYQIQVYSTPVGNGGGGKLTTHKAKLRQDARGCTVQMRVPGLSAGSHRLLIVIAIYEPIKMLGYYEGPIIRVTEAQPDTIDATPSEVALSG